MKKDIEQLYIDEVETKDGVKYAVFCKNDMVAELGVSPADAARRLRHVAEQLETQVLIVSRVNLNG